MNIFLIKKSTFLIKNLINPRMMAMDKKKMEGIHPDGLLVPQPDKKIMDPLLLKGRVLLNSSRGLIHNNKDLILLNLRDHNIHRRASKNPKGSNITSLNKPKL
jgi:hypothetical protein